MINVYKYEATNEDDCYEKCIEELDVYRSEIIIESEELEDSYKMTVVKKEDIINFIKEYVKTIGSKMNLDIKLEVRESDDIFSVTMVSNNNPILIGKDGRTINSLQLLMRQSLQNQTGMAIKVNLDASNYKAKKVKKFEFEIKNIVREVQKTKIDVSLDNMNSYERRIVHNVLTKFKNISTTSEGEEPNRHIVIRYVEDEEE